MTKRSPSGKRRIVRRLLIHLGLGLSMWEAAERIVPPFSWRPWLWLALYIPTYAVVMTWLEAKPATEAIEANEAPRKG